MRRRLFNNGFYLIFCERIIQIIGKCFDFDIKMICNQSNTSEREMMIFVICFSYLIFVRLTINFNAESLNSLSLFAYRQAKTRAINLLFERENLYQKHINYQTHENIELFRRKLHHKLQVFEGMYRQRL